MAHRRPHVLRSARQRQSHAIRLDIAAAFDVHRAERRVCDARFHRLRRLGVEPLDLVAGLLLLPDHRRLQPLRLVVIQRQSQGRALPELNVHARLLRQILRQFEMQPHRLLGRFRHRPRYARATQRTEAAIGETRGVAAHGIFLNHGRVYPGFTEVIRDGHARDAAAHNDHIAAVSRHVAVSYSVCAIARIAACSAISARALRSKVLPGSMRGHGEAPEGCGSGMASNAWLLYWQRNCWPMWASIER